MGYRDRNDASLPYDVRRERAFAQHEAVKKIKEVAPKGAKQYMKMREKAHKETKNA